MVACQFKKAGLLFDSQKYKEKKQFWLLNCPYLRETTKINNDIKVNVFIINGNLMRTLVLCKGIIS